MGWIAGHWVKSKWKPRGKATEQIDGNGRLSAMTKEEAGMHGANFTGPNIARVRKKISAISDTVSALVKLIQSF
jgi:hypothetical protein